MSGAVPSDDAVGLVFGIYPGGNVGTEDADVTGPASRSSPATPPSLERLGSPPL